MAKSEILEMVYEFSALTIDDLTESDLREDAVEVFAQDVLRGLNLVFGTQKEADIPDVQLPISLQAALNKGADPNIVNTPKYNTTVGGWDGRFDTPIGGGSPTARGCAVHRLYNYKDARHPLTKWLHSVAPYLVGAPRVRAEDFFTQELPRYQRNTPISLTKAFIPWYGWASEDSEELHPLNPEAERPLSLGMLFIGCNDIDGLKALDRSTKMMFGKRKYSAWQRFWEIQERRCATCYDPCFVSVEPKNPKHNVDNALPVVAYGDKNDPWGLPGGTMYRAKDKS